MTYPYIFANESGNQPASQLDTMFDIAGQQGNIPCTATGINAIVLVAQTNCYSPAGYTDGQLVSWVAVATSTGLVTMSAFGLGVVNYYDATGNQSTSGSIQIGNRYLSQYGANLNSGAGGFITLNSSGTAAVNTPVPVMGSFKNLLITNTTAGTAASQINVSFDEAVLENSSGGTVKVGLGFPGSGGLSFLINANSSGAAGLDTGSFTGNPTPYYIWVIYNPTTTTTAGLLSLSSTVPLLPAGYSYKGRAGGCIAVTGPKFVNWMQKGAKVQNLVGTYNSNALANIPVMATGTAGTFATTPTWAAVTLVGFVPATAKSVRGILSCPGGVAANGAMVAPNNNYGTVGSTTNPPPISFYSSSSVPLLYTSIWDMVIEVANTIYWVNSLAGNQLLCIGWEDNVNA